MRSIASLFLLAGAVSVIAGDWPQFRGPDGNGIARDAAPAKLSLDAEGSWSASLPGKGLSSPIIVGDRVFVTCSGGYRQQKLFVICYEAATGKPLWERSFWATGRTMVHEKTSVAAPTPASDGKVIVAIFSSNDAVCLDLDGNLLWLRGLGRDYPNASNSLGMSSSLLIADGVVVAQVESESDAFVAGLDLQTGTNRWKLARTRGANWTSPVRLHQGETSLVGLQSSKGFTAIKPATGETVWEFKDATSWVPSSAVSDHVLYLPSRGLTAFALSGDPGQPKELWKGAQLRPGTPSPLVLGDKVFALNDGGILTCGDKTSGARLWQLRLKGPFSATPIAAGQLLYCVSEKGVVQVVDVTKPEGEVVSELELGETVLSTPSIANGAIYFRSNQRLWKIGKS